MKKYQLLSVLLQLVGCLGMGIDLFVFDGISSPGPALHIFAVVFGLGLLGNLAFSLALYFQEKKSTEDI